ncbi:hypothetical protein [Gracilibacillus xinjiangensis]|uniref:Uncharacterized protein n=1 Tax=Gracilibacillus xinjiangensis TaxID=1193282 RepID=A0ABV8WY69_9BACI
MSDIMNLLEEVSKSTENLDINKIEKIITKLEQFSDECMKCKKLLADIENQLKIMQIDATGDEVRDFQQTFSQAKSHLMKQHKCITSGYYLATYMALGTSLGVVFGLTLFDNIGLGIPIGIGIGLGIGSLMDEDAKKKGLVI